MFPHLRSNTEDNRSALFVKIFKRNKKFTVGEWMMKWRQLISSTYPNTMHRTAAKRFWYSTNEKSATFQIGTKEINRQVDYFAWKHPRTLRVNCKIKIKTWEMVRNNFKKIKTNCVVQLSHRTTSECCWCLIQALETGPFLTASRNWVVQWQRWNRVLNIYYNYNIYLHFSSE